MSTQAVVWEHYEISYLKVQSKPTTKSFLFLVYLSCNFPCLVLLSSFYLYILQLSLPLSHTQTHTHTCLQIPERQRLWLAHSHTFQCLRCFAMSHSIHACNTEQYTMGQLLVTFSELLNEPGTLLSIITPFNSYNKSLRQVLFSSSFYGKLKFKDIL